MKLRSLAKDERGVVMVEFTLLVVLVVLPIAIAVAKWNGPVITWVNKTGATLSRNNELQEENNALLKRLLDEEGNTAPTTAPQPTPEPTPQPTQGTEPAPMVNP